MPTCLAKKQQVLICYLQIFIRWWLMYPYFDYFIFVSVLFTNQCKYNGIWWDCHQSERVSAIKPGLIHHFLHLKMPVPSQEYDSFCPFVFDAFCYLLNIDFAMWLWTFQIDFPLCSLFLWSYFFCKSMVFPDHWHNPLRLRLEARILLY